MWRDVDKDCEGGNSGKGSDGRLGTEGTKGETDGTIMD